jgi:hypothetical protein
MKDEFGLGLVRINNFLPAIKPNVGKPQTYFHVVRGIISTGAPDLIIWLWKQLGSPFQGKL